MDWWLLTFFLGAVLSLFLHDVPTIFQLLLLLFIACVAIRYFKHKNCAALLLGSFWILTHASLYDAQLPAELIDLMQARKSMIVEGEVLSLVAELPNKNEEKSHLDNKLSVKFNAVLTKRFNFRITKVNQKVLQTPIDVRLSWKKAAVKLAQGQRLQLNVKLKPAHGLANIGGFNYMSWLKAKNISATGYVKKLSKKQVKMLGNDANNKLLHSRISHRQILFSQYLAKTPDNELTAIILALAFGERSQLKPEHWQVLQTTGTSHLIAISGLHIGLLASGSFLLVLFIIRVLPLTSPHWQCFNAKYIAIFVSLLLALAYAYLAGFSLPTQRALVMLMLYWLSRLLAIKLSLMRLLLLTVFILIIISPFSLFTVSFWLSLYAVSIIFLSLWRFNGWLSQGGVFRRFFKGLIVIQLSLTVMLIPITAIFFQQISFVSILANIVAVPWMSFVTLPCTLLSLLLMVIDEHLARVMMSISIQSLSILWQYLAYLSLLPNTVFQLSVYQQVLLVLFGGVSFYIVFLSSCSWQSTHKRVLSALFILLSISTVSFGKASLFTLKGNQINDHSESKPWKVVFFDVGQGLSVLIERNGRAILYDTGAAYPSGFTLSEAVILPYLQYSAIKQLDKVILSHSDNDHAGGLKRLLDNISVKMIMSNDTNLVSKAVSTRAKTRLNDSFDTSIIKPCYSGSPFIWQGLRFEVLSPQLSPEAVIGKLSKQNTRQGNDDSCVILVTDKHGNNLLLTGDISDKVERQLLARYPTLKADILQVPHHGSKTSSTTPFLAQLAPKIAVVSAGYLNRWHMPVAKVSQRYQTQNINLLSSAEVGQVIITIDKDGISKRSYIDDLRPFWFSH